MTEVHQSRTCQVCKSDKQDAYCPVCKKETISDLKISVSETIKMREMVKGKVREGDKKPHFIFKTEDAVSGDPKLPDGVKISMSVDRRNDKYDQVVKDAKTGEILHEEHEPLSKHHSKKKS